MRRREDAGQAEGRPSLAAAEPLDDSRAGTRRIYSTSLFRADREVVIVHQGQEYRLRITRADKLILTK